MHLEFAVAPRASAEEAFFSDGPDDDSSDGILRLALDGFSELELARLGQLCLGTYQPHLILDGDVPEDIITGLDPALTRHLATQVGPAERPELARRWQAAIHDDNPQAGTAERIEVALDALLELATEANARNAWVLYAQIIDESADDD